MTGRTSVRSQTPAARRRRFATLAAAGCSLGLHLTACGPFRSRASVPAPYQEGIASWYGPGFEGRRTASGEVFDPGALTAAHPSLPFGSRIRVQNLANNRTVDVRINDRGPFTGNRILDLSRRAAELLHMIQAGVTRVRIFLLTPETGSAARRANVPRSFRLVDGPPLSQSTEDTMPRGQRDG